MANVAHASLTGANLHEPKGVAAAAINKIYLSDGAGSGTWQKLPTQGLLGISGNGSLGDVVGVDGSGNQRLQRMAHGMVYFVNLATPYSLTYPAVYTKIAPTTIAAGDSTEFTEATTSRLTYTGTNTKHIRTTVTVSFSQSVGATRDIQFAIYKNGSVLADSETVQTTTSAIKTTVTVIGSTTLVATDYLEVWCKNAGASGDVAVYALRMATISLNDVT
jgi:hypothetical protein